MVHHGVSFTFLRRSFLKDASNSSIAEVLSKIAKANAAMKNTDLQQLQLFQQEMTSIIEGWKQFEPIAETV
jgi:hypothetical protein